jgi:CRP/FNR family transcriptional regulator
MVLPTSFDGFPDLLKQEIIKHGILKTIPKGIEIVHEGQYIQYIPILKSGLVKVFIRHDDREFLLYYIQATESCVMSFYSVLKDEASKIIAQTEQETELLLLPSAYVKEWLSAYPAFNIFFIQLNNVRYTDLLQTIQALLFENLDTRVLRFLEAKARQNDNCFIKIRHREIADAMGTTREVISRVTKKLENEKAIEQLSDGILVRL